LRKEAELPAAEQDTYIIFGEAKIEDMSAQAQSGASITPPGRLATAYTIARPIRPPCDS
jgi:hypothetical protein